MPPRRPLPRPEWSGRSPYRRRAAAARGRRGNPCWRSCQRSGPACARRGASGRNGSPMLPRRRHYGRHPAIIRRPFPARWRQGGRFAVSATAPAMPPPRCRGPYGRHTGKSAGSACRRRRWPAPHWRIDGCRAGTAAAVRGRLPRFPARESRHPAGFRCASPCLQRPPGCRVPVRTGAARFVLQGSARRSGRVRPVS